MGDRVEDAAEVVGGGAAELEGEGHGREDSRDGDLRDAVVEELDRKKERF